MEKKGKIHQPSFIVTVFIFICVGVIIIQYYICYYHNFILNVIAIRTEYRPLHSTSANKFICSGTLSKPYDVLSGHRVVCICILSYDEVGRQGRCRNNLSSGRSVCRLVATSVLLAYSLCTEESIKYLTVWSSCEFVQHTNSRV